ncbi:DUF1056 family protein [Lactobacillus murinus]|uniref:DUF1056 family protein n=2 Tax=Ligilactobacillus murinus TaxID=1622 RepID=A0AAE6WHZ3_9LACO|nr:DUF1056 family protein [Ligilactobacillus murinus]NEF83607.1 DUF1056 family protein [Ligilactobacillus murinus]NEF85896.1 DUF1056 family protein [Ligilactobacillus murinus]NEF88170.1 DUF1056 family protein [Ligilactobacillus murinus]NEF90459.1 DUF1056 family protein [Ligilactobacillus murinus]NEF92705.1 DUF1056 family protein [Ligilactobacillus murinus]
MTTMIRNFFNLLWSVIDVLLFTLGIIFLVYGAFLLDKVIGFFALGIALIVLGVLTELANVKGGE